jgi:AcrR family transcriptional regulator
VVKIQDGERKTFGGLAKLTVMASRGPYAKTAPTRDQALTAVLAVIAERGLSSMSLQQIADAVGLTKQGLLYHFGSREGLLLEVIRRSDEINSVVSGNQSRFENLIELDERNMRVPGLLELYLGLLGTAVAESGDTPLRRNFTERYRIVRGGLADDVEALQAAGRMRDDLDPTVIATLMVAVSDGVQTQRLLDSSVPAIEALRALQTLLAPPETNP